MNGDGKPDVVGFGSAGVYVSLNNGSGVFATPALASNHFGTAQGWSSQSQDPRFLVDVNGDGKSDIVGFGAGGVYVALNNGSGVFATPVLASNHFGTAQGWSSQSQDPRFLVDVNGDGKSDIVGFGAGGVYVALNNGSGVFATPVLASNHFGTAQGWSSQSQDPRFLVDVNGDGKADIVGFGAGGVYVALNNGSGVFATPVLASNHFGTAQGWTSQDQFPRMLADVNGDSKPDIVGFGAGGVYVALNQGSGTFSSPSLVLNSFGTSEGWNSQSTCQRGLADVNGDGKLDIVGFGVGGVYAAINQGNDSFAAAALLVNNFGTTQGWSSFAADPRMFADINGDGRTDIVGFGSAGLYASTQI